MNGGETVFWGLVYLPGEPPSNLKMEEALREAGFDFARNVLIQPAFARTDHSALADDAEVQKNDGERTRYKAVDRRLQDWEL